MSKKPNRVGRRPLVAGKGYSTYGAEPPLNRRQFYGRLALMGTIDRSKYSPKADEGQPAWRRAHA